MFRLLTAVYRNTGVDKTAVNYVYVRLLDNTGFTTTAACYIPPTHQKWLLYLCRLNVRISQGTEYIGNPIGRFKHVYACQMRIRLLQW